MYIFIKKCSLVLSEIFINGNTVFTKTLLQDAKLYLDKVSSISKNLEVDFLFENTISIYIKKFTLFFEHNIGCHTYC